MKTLILASKSPRRKQLLEREGLKFKIVESGLEERLDPMLKPEELVEKLSLEKAKAVAIKFNNALIIGADSVVVFRNKIIGKPKDEKDAVGILDTLSGDMHYSVTGFTIYDTKTKKYVTRSVKTKIYFNNVSKQDIAEYVLSKKPLDKAGAYGIQELPKNFVKKIEGDFDNVVGLPVKAVLKELKNFL